MLLFSSILDTLALGTLDALDTPDTTDKLMNS